MWSSLKSDFAELVSVVQEDTTVVLEKMEDKREAQKSAAAIQEAKRRMGLEETFTIPLLQNEQENENEDDVGSSSDTASGGGVSDGGGGGGGELPGEEDEYAREAKQVEAFLKDFNVTERTDEVSKLLEEHPDTLRKQFETLVPVRINYKDFWTRYFYRCDAARIQHEWDAEDQRAREARAKLVGKVSNMLGGAAKVVATGMASALTEDDDGNIRASSSAKRAFAGSAGRPPFVMNTAVDEDEDDDEEEEELGWDDDDDDDDDDDGDDDGYQSTGAVSGITSTNLSAGGQETIEFKDELLEKTKEQLEQALGERDELHRTVEMQTQELANLRTGNKDSVEVEKLRATLKEREDELRAMKDAGMKSTDGGSSEEDATNLKVQQLTNLLSEKEFQMAKMQTAFDATRMELEQSVAALQKENAALKQADTKRQAELAASQQTTAKLTAELQAVKASLAAAEKSATLLPTSGLETSAKDEMPPSVDRESSNSGQTPSTVSTGVKVESPGLVSKIANDDGEDDDDWGDDWD